MFQMKIIVSCSFENDSIQKMNDQKKLTRPLVHVRFTMSCLGFSIGCGLNNSAISSSSLF